MIMKKILLAAMALVMTVAVSAAESTTYKGKLAIDLSGQGQFDMDEASDASITVTKEDNGTYTFVLNQFSLLLDGDEPTLIGDATISSLTPQEEDGAVVLTANNQEAPVTNGGELAGYIGGKVWITMTATIKDNSLTAQLDDILVNLLGSEIHVQAKFVSSEATGINSVSAGTASATSRVYDLSGRQLPSMQKGLNIVKTADGKSVKIVK